MLPEFSYLAGKNHALAKLGMDIDFDNPEQAAAHRATRGTIRDVSGAAGALGGGALGALGGYRRYGLAGGIIGGAAGALAGNKLLSHTIPTLYDAQRDVRQRTVQRYNQTRNELNAAAGIPAQTYWG